MFSFIGMIVLMQLHSFRMWGNQTLSCQIQHNSNSKRVKEEDFQNTKEERIFGGFENKEKTVGPKRL